jgi:hypothetical protein
VLFIELSLICLNNLKDFGRTKSFFFIEDILCTPNFAASWTVTLWVASPLVPHLSYAHASGRIGARNLCAPGPIFGSCEEGIGVSVSIHQLNNQQLLKKDIFTKMLFRQNNSIFVSPNISIYFKQPRQVPESRVFAISNTGCCLAGIEVK